MSRPLFLRSQIGLLLSIVILGGQTPQPQILDNRVLVRNDPALQETVYRITANGCEISWVALHTQVNAGIVQHRSKCSLPLDEQLALVSRLLPKVLADEPGFRTLFLGRLERHPGLPERLALLAKESSQWDVRSGRPKAGSTEHWIIANETPLFAEWQHVFHASDLRVRVSGVENVDVSPAGQLPFFRNLQKHGVDGRDRLPHDCLIWFAVTKEVQ